MAGSSRGQRTKHKKKWKYRSVVNRVHGSGKRVWCVESTGLGAQMKYGISCELHQAIMDDRKDGMFLFRVETAAAAAYLYMCM